MMNELIIAGIGILTTIISGFTSWFFARKKYDSEVDHNVIDNMKESLEFYEKLSNDNKLRLNEALEENKSLRVAINNLSDENAHLKSELENLKNQVLKLTTTICVDLSCQLRNGNLSSLNNNGKEKNRVNRVKNTSKG